MGSCKFCDIDTNISNTSNRGKGNKCFSVCKTCHYKQRIERYRLKKKQAIKYKGGKCNRCGYNKCDAALHFHHLNSEEKDQHCNLMRSWSLDKIKSELDKCELLCANCHAEEHWLVVGI